MFPCSGEPDLWFAEEPADLERAKSMCADCPIRRQCLTAALNRAEPWGVWGGEILVGGAVLVALNALLCLGLLFFVLTQHTSPY